MADSPLQVLTQLRELWSRQSKRRRTLAVVVLLGIAGIVAWSALASHASGWSALAEGSSPEDAQELLATLQGRGLPVRLAAGKVEVETERLDEARAIAAAAGLPRTGKGMELFDGSSLGQSAFAEQVNYRRALQGELARSITALAQVESARVHLALGKRSLFKDQDQGPSASVALHLHPGQSLLPDQVRGVRELVAASIEGLKPEAVVIVDNHGNLLDGADPSAVDRKAEMERSITNRVRSMLERVVGPGKVSVVTTADVDEGKVSETQEIYDHEHPVIRSETRSVEGANAIAGIGGVAGTQGNLPGAPAAAPTAGSNTPERLQETKNYELSRTVRQTQKADAQLTRLHVAVVVDFKAGADGKPAARTDQELAELTALAKQAAGIDDSRGDKIELHSIPFVPDPEQVAAAAPPPVKAALPMMWIEIGGGVALLLVVAVMVLALRRRRKPAETAGALALPVPIAELERALEARTPAGLAAASTEGQPLLPGRTLRDRVLDAVRGDVDRAAEVLTAWLAEPPRKGAK